MQARNPAFAGRVLIGGSKPVAGPIRYLILPEGWTSSTPFPAPPPAGAVVSGALMIVSTMPGNAHPL